MGYIATYFALRVADIATEGLEDKQTRHAELCRVAGIDSGGKSAQKKMITDAAFFGLLEHVAREFENGYTIAVRVGSTMRCDDYGAFGLAFKTAVSTDDTSQAIAQHKFNGSFRPGCDHLARTCSREIERCQASIPHKPGGSIRWVN